MSASEKEAGTSSSEWRFGDNDDLAQSLAGLAGIPAAQMPLKQLLTEVAQYAVQAIPGADGAGLTVLEQDRPSTIVTTVDFVSEVDAVQYSLGQGPCITAAREGVTVMSASLGDDVRWRQFGTQVAQLGVHSVLSLPLIAAGKVVGAMNVYAHAKDAFDDHAAELGEIYARPAAIAVQNAQVLDQTRHIAARLQAAVNERAVIERAVGIIMSRHGVDQSEALQRLHTLSRHEHKQLVTVAQNITDEAVRRARSRHRT